uniref:Uncharacterized protein n=1 Tax=Utricularia reniformis TaxID=192314 RepID=A0A1Y0AZC6_9LAMI|nr:hypothetical protein AEK19_MT0239 [Utricularia reniformis]ART30517.1 hypothetical protein AEK19_MT0239 [Utricularia reniformis]
MNSACQSVRVSREFSFRGKEDTARVFGNGRISKGELHEGKTFYAAFFKQFLVTPIFPATKLFLKY